jgi:hypothetical protein
MPSATRLLPRLECVELYIYSPMRLHGLHSDKFTLTYHVALSSPNSHFYVIYISFLEIWLTQI